MYDNNPSKPKTIPVLINIFRLFGKYKIVASDNHIAIAANTSKRIALVIKILDSSNIIICFRML